MSKRYLLIIAILFLVFAAYLYYMQDCSYSFWYMATCSKPFSLLNLTVDTWSEFRFNWVSFCIAFAPPIAGYIYWWLRPSKWRYFWPTFYLFLCCNWFIKWALGGVMGIKEILHMHPAYYAQIPAWLQFIVKFFRGIGGH